MADDVNANDELDNNQLAHRIVEQATRESDGHESEEADEADDDSGSN